MPELARHIHAAVVEFLEVGSVDFRRKRERRPDETVLVARDEVGLPFKPLHLPCSQAEGGNGNRDCGSVSAAQTREYNPERGVLRSRRPGPCFFFPARIICGGLSRMETKSFWSAGEFAYVLVCREKRGRGGRVEERIAAMGETVPVHDDREKSRRQAFMIELWKTAPLFAIDQ